MPSVGGWLEGKEIPLDRIDYELAHNTEEGDSWVLVTFDLGFAEVEVQFDAEQAEEFIVEFRDELVRAKQASLEQQTDTDSDTGVAKPDGGAKQ